MSKIKIWTPERLSVLRAKYLFTKLSMSQIALELNALWGTDFNRNSICGAINRHVSEVRKDKPRASRARMDLSDKPKKEYRARAPKKPKHLPPALRPKPVIKRQDEAPEVPPITLFELTESTCRWPLGEMMDEPPYLFCGRRVLTGCPYCAKHQRTSINASRGFKKQVNADQFSE